MRSKVLRQLSILFIALLACFFTASMSSAQDVSIEVELSTREIALGSTAQLMITVNGSQDVEPIEFPDVEGFDIDFLGPSTRVSIVNGQYSASKTLTYSLFPHEEGTFEIPALKVVVSGQTYVNKPIAVEVKAPGAQTNPSSPGQPVSLKDKLFLVTEISKSEVYLNERLNVKVSLFVSGLNVQDVQYPKFDGVGFSVSEYGRPKEYRTVMNGLRYDVVEFNTEIYPTRTGQISLGPAKSHCNIIIQDSGNASPSGRRGPFNDDFFNSFFGRGGRRQAMVFESDAILINVLDLPQEGKPDDFSGAVGNFSFNVSVSPTEIKEGDPITLRMTVMGDDNLAAIQMPSLRADSEFKQYDPQVLEKDNIKRTEQVIIPQSHMIKEVPAISFSYFDTQAKQYKTIARGPFPINVKKLEEGEEFKVVGLEGDIRTVEPETLGQDIIFIKNRPGRLRIAGKPLLNSIVYYISVLLAAVLWLAGFIYYKHSARVRTDSVYARRLLAPKQARQGLAQAQKLIASGKREAFYDAVFKTIQQYLGNKFHLSSGAVTFEAVSEPLKEGGIEQTIIDDIKLTYEECDRVRYASADISEENMKQSYQRLAQIIDHLERFLK